MFESKKFGNLGSHIKSGATFQLWSYLGDVDDKDTIKAAGYFQDTKEALRKNDIIKVLDLFTAPSTYFELRVSSISLSGPVLTEELASSDVLDSQVFDSIFMLMGA